MHTVRFIKTVGSAQFITDEKFLTRAEAVKAVSRPGFRPGPKLLETGGLLIRVAIEMSK